MADRSQKAQERVRQELQKNPGAGTKELQDAAASVEPSVAELSLRQFNAGYVLPLKRAGSGGRKKGRGSSPAPRARGGRKSASPAAAAPRGRTKAPAPEQPQTGDRDTVRSTLLEFARDFSEAESRSDIVGVLSDLDRYIDKIVGPRG